MHVGYLVSPLRASLHMRHRLENATDFFPLPVAQVALCPSSVSHFPFYGSPPSFLVEASLLPAVGSSWRGLWACKADMAFEEHGCYNSIFFSGPAW